MNDNEETGIKNLNEYLAVIQIVSLLLLLIISSSLLPGEANKLPDNFKIITIGIWVIGLFFIYIIWIFFLGRRKRRINTKPSRLDILLSIIYFFLITAIIYKTGAHESPYKNIFLLLVVMHTLKFGTVFGAVSVIFSSIGIMLNDLIILKRISNNPYLEADIVLIGVLIITNWLLGSFIKMIEDDAVHRARLETIAEMAGEVAHEIRNPLVAVKGFIQLEGLKEESSLDKGVIKLLLREIQRIEEIIAEFLKLGEAYELKVTEIDLRVLFKRIKLMMKTQLGFKNIFIEIKVDEHVPLIKGDVMLLRQVFVNIVKKAFETVGNGGKVEISASYVNNEVKVEISANRKTRGPFLHAQKEKQAIGLTINEMIIEKHKGRIEVLTKSDGGLQFTVFLPA
ncbi:Sporulation kinase A [Koleobacter methoxysyntrophicus]|uniref:histidine kinase n=1 Tax=Koleobacter methoxysyntrophicus TaxID=2751313 RepID=A0A8A0RNM4_9FIRM|nr:histidine kinase dimerization/phospho-acceptor domain-containing protein [Koleobacter methoxysyntrophicus]QSQ09188.1 Sporulation kinase A [Koleobacter methoxysyntrophicus]